MTGGVEGPEREENLGAFFFFLKKKKEKIKYSLLRYKKLHGALAMAETKP